jgi:hypothetical protein
VLERETMLGRGPSATMLRPDLVAQRVHLEEAPMVPGGGAICGDTTVQPYVDFLQSAPNQ